jgi:hypothetical protein
MHVTSKSEASIIDRNHSCLSVYDCRLLGVSNATGHTIVHATNSPSRESPSCPIFWSLVDAARGCNAAWRSHSRDNMRSRISADLRRTCKFALSPHHFRCHVAPQAHNLRTHLTMCPRCLENPSATELIIVVTDRASAHSSCSQQMWLSLLLLSSECDSCLVRNH